MKRILSYSAAILSLAVFASQARADTFQFSFSGPAVSGNVALTYGKSVDARYPEAIEVTGISGAFSDVNLGIVNAAITGLETVNHSKPEATNLLAPSDFSRFPVASGTLHGSLSFDNLLYLRGSPQTATDYPFSGGFLDIYGVLFDLGNGDVVNLWSNGVLPRAETADYGVAVASNAKAMDYVGGGVTVTPEPSAVWLFGSGALAMLAKRRLFLKKPH